ncbi:MAG: urease accessory protein UreJ [Ideonella sp. MAG2]|nr:MAG: urease accessory protein UreJ [Ideonella sp. MAG2]
MTRPLHLPALLGIAVSALLPSLALAHTGADGGHHQGFATGFIHPLTGLDHLLAMLSVGVWTVLSAPKAGLRAWAAAPASFALLLLLGALLTQAGWALPTVEPMIALSLLVLGVMVVLRQALPTAYGAALVGGFALFHGAAHGHELSGAAALLGVVLASALLHGLGLCLGHLLCHRSMWLGRLLGLGPIAVGTVLLWA